MSRNYPNLTISRQEAVEKIDSRLKEGEKIRNMPTQSEQHLTHAWAEYKKWNDYNTTLLRGMFDTSEIADEYAKPTTNEKGFSLSEALGDVMGYPGPSIQRGIDRLESIKERLELYREKQTKIGKKKARAKLSISDKSFIIHGHDKEAKDTGAEQPKLTISRTEAKEKISEQIKKGKDIRDAQMNSVELLEEAKAEYRLWDADTVGMLSRIFDSIELSDEYGKPSPIEEVDSLIGVPSELDEQIRCFRDHVTEKIWRLSSIRERLSRFEEPIRKIFRFLFQYLSVVIIFILFIIGRNAFPGDYLAFAAIFITILLGVLVAFRLLKSLQGILMVVLAFILVIFLRPSPP